MNKNSNDFAELCIMLGCAIEHNENENEKPFSEGWEYEKMLDLAQDLYKKWLKQNEFNYKSDFIHQEISNMQEEFENLDK